MSVFFVDTSALAKRYVIEPGSLWVRSWIVPSYGNVIIIADSTPVEMFSLLARHERDGALLPANAALLRQEFLLHTEKEYLSIALDQRVLQIARNLVNKHPLRALDAMQLACALQAASILNEPITFVSGDDRLLLGAGLEGFAVDNPYLHP